MEGKKWIVLLLFLLGAFFLGRGITGLYLMDFEQQPCVKDFDCNTIEVCCKFYHEDYGVCDSKENCAAIESVTREELQATDISSKEHDAQNKIGITQKKLMSALKTHYERPQKQSQVHSVFVGAVLLLFALIVFYVNSKSERQ